MQKVRILHRESQGDIEDFLRRAIFGVVGFLAIALGPDIASKLWPVSHWYELRSVQIGDGPDFDKLPMTVEREIHQPFKGTYRVVVWPADMSAPTGCRGGATHDYQARPAKTLHVNPTWWIEDQPRPCRNILTPGRYVMITCIEVYPETPMLAWLTNPRTCFSSNAFSITKRD